MPEWIHHFFSETGQGFPLAAAALLVMILILRLYKVGWSYYEKSATRKKAYERYKPLLEEAIEHYQKLTVICRQHPPGSPERLTAVHQLGVRPDFPIYDLTGCSTAHAYYELLSAEHQKEIREIARMIDLQQLTVIGTGREQSEAISEDFLTEENLKSNDHLQARKTKAIILRLKKLLGD